MSIFEIIMLVCFGVSWPISILKTVKSRKISGKSPLFLIIIIVGYASGIFHKVFFSMDWVISLYIVNLIMVSIDLSLYYYYSKKNIAEAVN